MGKALRGIASGAGWLYAHAVRPFLAWLFGDFRNLALIVALLAAGSLYVGLRDARADYVRERSAAADTLGAYKDKVGRLYAQVGADITDMAELRRTNRELYDQVRDLKDRVVFLSKIKTETRIDTLVMSDTLYVAAGGGTYESKFSKTTEYYSISGTTFTDVPNMLSIVTVNGIYVPATLDVDLIEKDGSLRLVAASGNPYVSVTGLNGAVLSPEKVSMLRKRFRKPWGVDVGTGAAATAVNGTVVIRPAVTLTLGYRIISF